MIFLRSRLCLVLLGIGIASGAGAAVSPEAQAVRERRLGLLKAVNSHNVRAVQAYVHPSFVGMARDGQTVSYAQTIQAVREVLKHLPDFRERLTIERILVKGDRAELTGTSIHTYTESEGVKARVRQRSVQTWMKLRGRWMLVRDRIL